MYGVHSSTRELNILNTIRYKEGDLTIKVWIGGIMLADGVADIVIAILSSRKFLDLKTFNIPLSSFIFDFDGRRSAWFSEDGPQSRPTFFPPCSYDRHRCSVKRRLSDNWTMQRNMEHHLSRNEPNVRAMDEDSTSNHSVAPPPRYSYRRESNTLHPTENVECCNDDLADIGNYLMQAADEEDLTLRLTSPHSTENLRTQALDSENPIYTTTPNSERCSRPCSTRSPSPHPVRRHSSGHKRSSSQPRPDSCPIHGYTHTHSQCLPDYAAMTTPMTAVSRFDNPPPVPRLTAGDFRRLAQSLHSRTPQTLNTFQRDHYIRPTDEFGYTEQIDPFCNSVPKRASSLHQNRSTGSYVNHASHSHRPIFSHHHPQPQESPVTLTFQQRSIYPAAVSSDGEVYQNSDHAPTQFYGTKQALGQEVSHVQGSLLMQESEVPQSQQCLSLPNNTRPSRPRSSCKPLKITKKASLHGPLSVNNVSTYPRPNIPLPAPKPSANPSTNVTATNFVHLSRTTTPPSKRPLFSKSVFKPLKSPDRADARHLIFNNGLRKSLSPSSSIIGKFVIDPTLSVPGGLLRAVDSSCLPLEELDLDRHNVPSRVRDAAPPFNHLERYKSAKRVESDICDLDATPHIQSRKNLMLEVKNGGIDIDVHIVPSYKKTSSSVPTLVDLYVKDTVMRKRKGNTLKAVRNTDPFPLIARIVAPHPRQPIHVVATTMPLPKPDTPSSELTKNNSIKNDTHSHSSTSHSNHRRTQSQPNQTQSRRPTSGSGLVRSPSARTSKTRASYAHPAPPRSFHQGQTANGYLTSAGGSGSGPSAAATYGAPTMFSDNPKGHNSVPAPVLRHLSLPLSPIHLSLPNTFRGALVVRVSAGNIDAHLTLSDKLRASAVVLSEKGGVRGFYVGSLESLTDQSGLDTSNQQPNPGFPADEDQPVMDYVVSQDPCDLDNDDVPPESSDFQHVVLESDRDDNIDDEDDKNSASSTSGPDSDADPGTSGPLGRQVQVRAHDEPNNLKAKEDSDTWQGDRLEVVVGDGHVWLQFEGEEDPFGLRDGFWTRLGKICGFLRK